MNTELHQNLVRNMKRRRSVLGISQMELAERAGLSSGYVGEIEMGRKFPAPEALESLAAALGLRPYRLLMGDEDVAEWLGDEAFYAVKDELRARLIGELDAFMGPNPREGSAGEPGRNGN